MSAPDLPISAEAGFDLYDLRVEVVGPPDKQIYCGAKIGDFFELHGEMLILPPGQGFSIYSLAALLPLLPAKQRVTDPNDWMSSDAEVACPDPNCPTRFRITRTGIRHFKRSEVTAVPLLSDSKLYSRASSKEAGTWRAATVQLTPGPRNETWPRLSKRASPPSIAPASIRAWSK